MMCSCDQLRKLVAQMRPVGRMSLEPIYIYIYIYIYNIFTVNLLRVYFILAVLFYIRGFVFWYKKLYSDFQLFGKGTCCL